MPGGITSASFETEHLEHAGFPGLRTGKPGRFIGANENPGGQDPRVELDWLETFLAVVDRGGFAAASEAVHRSQSRVSAHIAALERDLGVRLIDRAHRPARLTAAGEVFARHAREKASQLPDGPDKEQMLRKALQAETASSIEDWANAKALN